MVCPQLSVAQFAEQVHLHLVAVAFACVFFHLAQDAFRFGLQFVNGIGVGGVEGQGNHRLLRAQVDTDHAVVVSHLARAEFAVVLGAVVQLIVVAHLLVCRPDGTEAGRFRRHHVDAVAEIRGKFLHAGAGELKYFIFYEAIFKHSLDQRNGHVVRSHAPPGLAFEPYEHHLRSLDVPRVAQQLFGQFAAAFAHAHAAQRAVAGV